MIKLGYTIFYVADVQATANFYHSVFNLEIKLITPEKDYAEMATGDTTLSFCSYALAQSNFEAKFIENNPSNNPAGFDIVLLTDEVQTYYQNALEAGAVSLKEPVLKPWGQTVAFIRDINGIIVEIATPIG